MTPLPLRAASRSRRQAVVAIKGSMLPDVITQANLNECANLQAAVWLAERAAHMAIERLRVRIMHGAVVEDCGLFFDRELKMVRRKI